MGHGGSEGPEETKEGGRGEEEEEAGKRQGQGMLSGFACLGVGVCSRLTRLCLRSVRYPQRRSSRPVVPEPESESEEEEAEKVEEKQV